MRADGFANVRFTHTHSELLRLLRHLSCQTMRSAVRGHLAVALQLVTCLYDTRSTVVLECQGYTHVLAHSTSRKMFCSQGLLAGAIVRTKHMGERFSTNCVEFLVSGGDSKLNKVGANAMLVCSDGSV